MRIQCVSITFAKNIISYALNYSQDGTIYTSNIFSVLFFSPGLNTRTGLPVGMFFMFFMFLPHLPCFHVFSMFFMKKSCFSVNLFDQKFLRKKSPYVHSTSFVCFLGTTSGKNSSLPATTIISRSGIHSFDELKIIVLKGRSILETQIRISMP